MEPDSWATLFFEVLRTSSPFHWQHTYSAAVMCATHQHTDQVGGVDLRRTLSPCYMHPHATFPDALLCAIHLWYSDATVRMCKTQDCGFQNIYHCYNFVPPRFMVVNMATTFDSQQGATVNWRDWRTASRIISAQHSLHYELVGIAALVHGSHFTVRFKATDGQWWLYDDLDPVPALVPRPDDVSIAEYGVPVACVYVQTSV
jgi:hypothetical protein